MASPQKACFQSSVHTGSCSMERPHHNQCPCRLRSGSRAERASGCHYQDEPRLYALSHSYTDQCVPAYIWLPLDREGHLISRQSPHPTVKSAILPSLQDPPIIGKKPSPVLPNSCFLLQAVHWDCHVARGSTLCSCLHGHPFQHWEGSDDDNQYGNRGISQAQVIAQHGSELHHRAKRYTCTSQTRKGRCFKFQDWETQRGSSHGLLTSP